MIVNLEIERGKIVLSEYNGPGVYLLHFSPSYKHARHYLGFAWKVKDRVDQHRAGRGARLTQVAIEAGCELVLTRVWRYWFRMDERRLKSGKNSPKLCPICVAEKGEEARRRCKPWLGLDLGLLGEMDVGWVGMNEGAGPGSGGVATKPDPASRAHVDEHNLRRGYHEPKD